MPSDLDERLISVTARLRAKQKLKAMRRHAEEVLRTQRSECARLEEELTSEQQDVTALEGLSLTGLFYTLLGSKTERLAKQRSELLKATLKHEASLNACQDAQQELNRVRDAMAPYEHLEAEYEQLIAEKGQFLVEHGDAEPLLRFSQQLANLESETKEFREAMAAGETALQSLELVKSDLQSAASWGNWDLLGGGMLSTMAKHAKISAAKEKVLIAQRKLQRFQAELADADQRLHVALEIDGFSKFADYFFDGLIADWLVQTKVRQASTACESTIERVESALRTCLQGLKEAEQEIVDVSQRRQTFIEQA